MMKNFTLLLLFTFGSISAQIVNIPDANFKAKLLEASPNNYIAKDSNGNFYKIDANDDGEIQVSEALETTYLKVAQASISDLTGIESFVNLTGLVCFHNNLTDIDISQNILLQLLLCDNNQLNSLDITQNINLVELNFRVNQISDIDLTQNVNLEKLVCNHNILTSLNVSQNTNLNYLICSTNQLTSLNVAQNDNLETLLCGNNELTSLITQNENLNWLECSYNDLTTIDISQNTNLTDFRCAFNVLTELDLTQNASLLRLYCNDNQLTNLDLSQNESVFNIKCYNNDLINIDLSINSNLLYMECNDNQLETIDVSHCENLQSLNCSNNNLETIFMKNGTIDDLISLQGNPDLNYVCADDGQIQYLQSVVNAATVVNSYCSFTPGGNYNTITGTTFFDAENNGCDTDNPAQFNVKIDINDGTNVGATITNSNGEYMFFTPEGSFNLTPTIENAAWFTLIPNSAEIIFSDTNLNVSNQNFCISTNGTYNDLEIVISPLLPAQPGFDAVYQIIYKNKGNQMLSGVVDLIFNDAVLDYVSASVAPDMQVENNLSWNFSDLLPFESRAIEFTLNVNNPMEDPAVNNDNILHFNVAINPSVDDETPLDNSFDYSQTVVGSYDPNDITCLEGDIVSPEKIGEYLHYTINFENTGTAAATFIVVKDVIDSAQYDLNTLQVVYSSHEMMTRINNEVVEFIFDDINLEAEGKGNIVFKIKTKNNLVLGDSVSQKADIFFDYNFPIETNTATTVFDVLSVEEFAFNMVKAFPNPVSEVMTLNSKQEIRSYDLIDLQGRLIKTGILNDYRATLDFSNFKTGIYLLNLSTERGTETIKVIKN